MRKGQTVLRGAALWALTSVLLACGGGPIAIKGRVLDDKGTALKGAEVESEPATDSVQSTSQGYFVISRRVSEEGETLPLEAGTYTLHIRMLGFADAEVQVKVESGEVVLPPVTLQVKELDVGDTAPDASDEKEKLMDDSSPPVSNI